MTDSIVGPPYLVVWLPRKVAEGPERVGLRDLIHLLAQQEEGLNAAAQPDGLAVLIILRVGFRKGTS